PIIARLAPLSLEHADAAETYCQLLEHKWYLSEAALRDVGHEFALDDYLAQTERRVDTGEDTSPEASGTTPKTEET
ncbi:MAG: DUF4032 domain-containing protein, partial [Deltaproteobacteria bacterium]|nr:DUF4032 domain-containing protein [Deltaproteobacteria bacterium]